MPRQKAPSKQSKIMADGCEDTEVSSILSFVPTDGMTVNEARAMRVAEVMNDFQMLQQYIMQPQPNPSAEDYHEAGYEILRQCRAAGSAVLSAQFEIDPSQLPDGSGEPEKRQLQR